MIADTIVVVMICINPIHNINSEGKFTRLFEQADSSFNKEYRIDIEALKRASSEAVKESEIKTKIERDKCINQFHGITKMVKKELK